MDKKISKQVGSKYNVPLVLPPFHCILSYYVFFSTLTSENWLFEFQVKFFPYNIDTIAEDLTRYFLCLQVRQNLLSGQ